MHTPPRARANADAACDVLHSVSHKLTADTAPTSSWSQGISIMPLCPPPCPHSHNVSPATPEIVKHWTYANSMEAYN